MNLIKIWTSLVTAMFICVCLSSTCSFFFCLTCVCAWQFACGCETLWVCESELQRRTVICFHLYPSLLCSYLGLAGHSHSSGFVLPLVSRHQGQHCHLPSLSGFLQLLDPPFLPWANCVRPRYISFLLLYILKCFGLPSTASSCNVSLTLSVVTVATCSFILHFWYLYRFNSSATAAAGTFHCLFGFTKADYPQNVHACMFIHMWERERDINTAGCDVSGLLKRKWCGAASARNHVFVPLNPRHAQAHCCYVTAVCPVCFKASHCDSFIGCMK